MASKKRERTVKVNWYIPARIVRGLENEEEQNGRAPSWHLKRALERYCAAEGIDIAEVVNDGSAEEIKP